MPRCWWSVPAALAFAFEEAALRRARLLAVHAWAWSVLAGGEAAGEEGRLAALLDTGRDQHPEVDARSEVVQAHPGRVLARASARADLVVLGRHAPGEHAPGVGSVTHSVLSHAHGPVVSVPRE
jgi:nucleotide-binding universal stress UspA family protein